MSAPGASQPLPRMTSEQFVAWAIEQPETEHYELYAGQVVAMAPEREARGFAKSLIGLRLFSAIEQQGLDCAVYVDGATIRVDAETAFEPDVVVRCGPRPDPNTLTFDDPLIVVEVLSPSTKGIDKTRKLASCLELLSVRHYLIVDVDKRRLVHHRRDAAGLVTTSIVAEGPLVLDPPGIVLDRFWGGG